MGKSLSGRSMESFSFKIPNYMTRVSVERGCLPSYPTGVLVKERAAPGLGNRSSPSGGRMLTSNINVNDLTGSLLMRKLAGLQGAKWFSVC